MPNRAQKQSFSRREALKLTAGAVSPYFVRPAHLPSMPLRYRWVYIQCNLQVQSEVARLKTIFQKAATAGYNGVVIADYKLSFLDKVLPIYFQNAREVVHTARQLNLKIYPAVCPIGYSNSLLVNDPNLAEGVPVKDATYVVKGAEATLLPFSKTYLTHGDFRQAHGDVFVGWNFQDAPGQSTFADNKVTRGSLPSLRIEELHRANARIMQKVSVAPWRQMRLSVWAKTEQFQGGDLVGAVVLGNDGQNLAYMQWDFAPIQEWRQYSVVFNTLQNKEISLYLGVWAGSGGKLWFNDVTLEEVGLLNVLRRPGCPVIVRNEQGRKYLEGRDFEPIRDPALQISPGDYDITHMAPTIHLTPHSTISDGETLFVSFYHPIPIYGWAVSCCLSDPKVYSLLQSQIQLVQQHFEPDGFFFSHDEMRVANWCASCQSTHKSPGQLLAYNIRRCAEMARAVAPTAEQFVWSDMFDPYHNAVAHYYLVNGSLVGSWKGLPKEMVVVNWNQGHDKQSMNWFAGQGHRQILAGYYDGQPESIRDWLRDASPFTGIVGVMYTTWQSKYDDLEAFAEAAWGKKV